LNKSHSKRMKSKAISIIHPLLFFLVFSMSLVTRGSSFSPHDLEKNEVVKGELGKKIDTYLSRITRFGFSGALLVAKDGEIILNKGYGMAIRSEDVPNTSETVFSTGSITKQFTAAGIMKLETQGKLNTNDPITKFFENVPKDKVGITLHHLLTHTSGVINYTGMDYEKAQQNETVRKILDAPLLFKPGERFEYSNAGYSLLAAVIEKVSGQSYEEFVHEQLFKPAGMKFTGYRIPQWDKKVVAHWYVGDKDNGTPLEKPYPYWNLLGNGGILSTTEDMYKWHLALLGNKVLSDAAKKKIFTPFLNDYGYGWDVLETERGTLIQHDGGSMLGNSAEVRRYIDAKVVTILFCNQSYDQRALFNVIRDKIETLAFGGDVTIPPSVVSLDPEELQKYEGIYSLPSGGRLEIKGKRGGLLLKPEGQDAISTLFFPEADPELIKDLNKLSVSVFEAALEGNYQPFENVLHNKEERKVRVRQFIEMRLQRYKESTGKIHEVIANYTLPSSLDGEEAVLTYVQLKGEKGSIFFGLYWQNKKNIGVAPVMAIPEISIPFRLISGTEFNGYRLDMAKNIRISFVVDEKGTVKGLKVPSPKKDFITLIKTGVRPL
jgi:CubicO group peptidase (beta-lactamase class C family)